MDIGRLVVLVSAVRGMNGRHALAPINSWGDALMHCFRAERVEAEL
jgi:hypothetical protein